MFNGYALQKVVIGPLVNVSLTGVSVPKELIGCVCAKVSERPSTLMPRPVIERVPIDRPLREREREPGHRCQTHLVSTHTASGSENEWLPLCAHYRDGVMAIMCVCVCVCKSHNCGSLREP